MTELSFLGEVSCAELRWLLKYLIFQRIFLNNKVREIHTQNILKAKIFTPLHSEIINFILFYPKTKSKNVRIRF